MVTKLIRTVRFPLKAKLILLFMLLLSSALTFYVYFALDLFNKDKSAYIYENGLAHAESLSHRMNSFFSYGVSFLSMTGQMALKNHLNSQNFENSGQILSFSLYGPKDGGYQKSLTLINKKELNFYQSSEDELMAIEKREPINFKEVNPGQIYVRGFFYEKVPHLLLAIQDAVTKHIFVGRFLISEIQQSFNNNKIYESYLVNNNGEILYHNAKKLEKSVVINQSELLEILSSDLESGVKQIERDGEEKLVAYHKNATFHFTTFAEISVAKAFSAAKFLEEKSIWFGLFILSLAIMIAILFSRRLTKHLDKLYAATEKMAQGEFGIQVKVSAHDEIGALSDSFNYMGQEILRYISEMEEKTRLENELAVAKLVQDSFFPDKDLSYPEIDISAFYTPASECGGDWWGQIHQNGKTLITIIDATGHGVPAALLTATANCCFENLRTLSQSNPHVIDSPSQVLSFMNQAVCAVGSDILMTAFVALIDYQNKTLTYANASHNPPFLYQYKESAPDKSDVIPLMNSNGPRLGHEKTGQFHNETMSIKSQDTIIFFTDGIVEGVNPEGKEWGQRRFMKSILASVKGSPSVARDAIIKEAFEFYQDKKNDDDITLVMAKIK